METKFKKVSTTKDIIISAAVLLAGVGLFFLNKGLGAVVAAAGLVMLLVMKSGFKASADGPVLSRKALDVAHSCRSSLYSFLKGEDVEPVVSDPGDGGVVRLELYFNKEAGVAYAQLFDFSNYAYEPATELVELSGSRAEKLLKKI